MFITKCDICKKEVKDHAVKAGLGYLASAELCQNCGLPVLKFLEKNKFIRKEKSEFKEYEK
ncbi:MAG: hypothetical protein A3F47_00850 [Candidatus Staskawiczbacteria bacterium RIFCSPHIGHO2_12_FULL_38_11]|uniref:LIM zinc-binding domain-containing protein n=1 Tax=Candidatus Staskawiczbacteria bacterium RIFCSPHIGHO2_12_FULL_38_11 TaxID=1802209 RepID=A0A1G2I6G3_9BACT|nr:MAG: hypothetical protein A3F47_00850 [Candidatus Staskawiczbacteria bacterium RIFCSPHIGHO2_12_FULL_38_11]